MKFLSILVSLLVPLQCFGEGTYHFYFPPTTKLREGNVFSHVSLSVCLFMGVGPHHTGPQPPLSTGLWSSPCTRPGPAPLDMFKLVQVGPQCTPTPRHVQTCSLCSLDSGQAGSWHSTEIPFCQR